MFSVAPNILLAPNMTQNAERKHRTQDANTAHNRLHGKGEHTWQRGDMHGKGWGACVVRGCMNLSKFGWLIIYTDIYLLARASNKCDK